MREPIDPETLDTLVGHHRRFLGPPRTTDNG
jgi:hypothetical protein